MIAMNFVIVKYQMKYVKYTNPDEETVMIRRLIILLLIVGCGTEPEQDKYCIINDDCTTGQSCIEGKCENYITDN